MAGEFPSSRAVRELAELVPGTLIGGYRIEERIGAGGMAVVFRARDEALGRPVALKVLAPALASDTEFRERFIRESRAASAVDHPNIIPVHWAGEDRGVLYLAMRYVSGGDLHSVVEREGPLPPERAVSLLSPVASALDAAHAAGIVHRDVKPANVLVDVNPGRPDHPYLSDFGLARQESGSLLTSVGEFVGTAGFAAPEQIDGQPPQFATDQYALACVAFTLLTARLPFQSGSPQAVLWAQMAKSPPRVTEFRPDLPASTDYVLARALALNPADRFPSCAGFVDALGRALAGDPRVGDPRAGDPVAGSPVSSGPPGPRPDQAGSYGVPPPPWGPGSGHPSFPDPAPGTVPVPESPATARSGRSARRFRGALIAGAAGAVLAAVAVTVVIKLNTGTESTARPAPEASQASVATPKVSAKLALTMRTPGDNVIVAVSASGGRLTILDSDDTAYKVSLQTKKVTGASALHSPGPGGALLSLDGAAVAAPDSDCGTSCAYHLFWFDVPDAPDEWDGRVPAGPGSSAAVGDFTLAVSGTQGSGIQLVNLRTLVKPAQLTDPEHRKTGAIGLSPDGSTVAAVTAGPGGARQVCVWNSASPNAPSSFSVPGKMGVPWENSINGQAGTPVAVAGSVLALSDGLNTNVYSVTSRRLVRSLPGALLGLSPDGQFAVTSDPGAEAAVDLRNTTTGQVAATLTGPGEQQYPSAVSFSPDGQSLIVGYVDGGTDVWTLTGA